MKKITIKRTCPACHGRGKSYGRQHCGYCHGRHKITETVKVENDEDVFETLIDKWRKEAAGTSSMRADGLNQAANELERHL